MNTTQLTNKVAKITLLFWVLKIIATTLGETFGDFLSMTLNLGYGMGILITVIIFLTVLIFQLSLKSFKDLPYWLVIIGTTTLGTEISDFLDRSLHVGYLGGSLFLFSLLLATLFYWYKSYGNLQVYPIALRKKEILYWSAILISNSLGTAFGDFLSDNLGLSYLYGALITGAIILIVVLLHYFSKLNEVLLFWIAFIFTRPFGATFGDFLTKPLEKGGLNLGTWQASVVCMVLMLVFVYISYRKNNKKRIFDAS